MAEVLSMIRAGETVDGAADPHGQVVVALTQEEADRIVGLLQWIRDPGFPGAVMLTPPKD